MYLYKRHVSVTIIEALWIVYLCYRNQGCQIHVFPLFAYALLFCSLFFYHLIFSRSNRVKRLLYSSILPLFAYTFTRCSLYPLSRNFWEEQSSPKGTSPKLNYYTTQNYYITHYVCSWKKYIIVWCVKITPSMFLITITY